jgi:hypothetical protein
MTAKSGGDSSSAQERRKARESSRAKGKGVGCSRVELASYWDRGAPGRQQRVVTSGG